MDTEAVAVAVAPSGAGMPKITMPSMPMSYARTVRYRRLDQLDHHALLWVAAPAGYGKSTLLSSYLRARGRTTVWYECDDGDADIASFFHFISLARSNLPLAPAPLPRFAPQYLAALPTFTRNFFRLWFGGLPAGSVLVLDNWHDVPAGSRLTQVLGIIAGEVPAGMQVVVVSRHAPDAALSRLLTSERMAVLGLADLQLSRTEIGAIVRRHGVRSCALSRERLDALHELTQGWAAAVTLLLRSAWTDGASWEPRHAAARDGVFGYLAAEAYGRLPPRVREFLLSVACLAHITVALARRVSGNDDAADILHELVRQNAFTAYHGSSDSYHLHPLFREFLSAQCARAGAEQARDRHLSAARALLAEAQDEAALHLFMQAQAWPEAVQVLRHFAPVLVRDARLETLLALIGDLPAQIARSDGWIAYWRGIGRSTLEPAASYEDIERAYALFEAGADATGAMLAAAAALMHIAFGYFDYSTMLPWIGRLESLLRGAPRFEDPSVELRVRTAFMTALSQALPTHPALADSVAQVSRLVGREPNVAMRAEAVSALMLFFGRFGQTATYGELDQQLQALLDHDALSPLHRLNLLWLKAYKLHAAGETPEVLSLLAEARALARSEGMHADDMRMSLCELQAQHPDVAPAAALERFSRLEPYCASMPPIARAHFLYVRAVFELGCGHVREALAYAEASVPMVRACHWHIGEALSLQGLAEIYCRVGRLVDAERCVAECEQLLGEVDAPLVRFNVGLARAEVLRLRDAPGYAGALAQVMALGRTQGYANGFHSSSRLLDQLIPEAFVRGIEPGYCRWVIAKRRLTPPSALCLDWPWPVRVRTLGGLSVEVEGTPLLFAGKLQRKPLELLKLLTTRGEGLEAASIMDTIWPELDGDGARNALDLALHRLRKLLACKQAVLSSSGVVALNPRVVWLDVAALAALRAGADRADPALALQVLSIYRGPYLAGEELHGALAAARVHQKKLFARLVQRLARQMASVDEWRTARRLYEQALDVEADEDLRASLAALPPTRHAGAAPLDA